MTFTWNDLPANGIVSMFVTADKLSIDPDESPDDPCIDCGWIDPSFSDSVLFESRNDVSPLFQYSVRDIVNDMEGDILAELRFRMGEYGCDPTYADLSSGPTAYAPDPYIPTYSEPYQYLYAVHLSVKYYDGTKYVESDVIFPDFD